jgi:hypothetical protein
VVQTTALVVRPSPAPTIVAKPRRTAVGTHVDQ